MCFRCWAHFLKLWSCCKSGDMTKKCSVIISGKSSVLFRPNIVLTGKVHRWNLLFRICLQNIAFVYMITQKTTTVLKFSVSFIENFNFPTPHSVHFRSRQHFLYEPFTFGHKVTSIMTQTYAYIDFVANYPDIKIRQKELLTNWNPFSFGLRRKKIGTHVVVDRVWNFANRKIKRKPLRLNHIPFMNKRFHLCTLPVSTMLMGRKCF
jgi:hypothetical protein